MNPFTVEAKIRDLSDKAATEFLSPLSEKRGSPDWIGKNAERIINESGKDLTQVVSKIASDENLNPHELARVCEETNKEVFHRLYKLSEDKTFQFPVADVNRALHGLNRPYEGPGDVFLPVEHPKLGAEEKTASVNPDNLSWARTALTPTDGQALTLALQEEKVAKQAFKELKYESEADRHQAAIDFMKEARDLVLEGGRTPSELYAMVKEARPGKPDHEKAARELLALVALDTGKVFPEGASEVVKYAKSLMAKEQVDMPADDLREDHETYEFWTKSPGQKTEAFISPVSSGKDPVKIINNKHAIFMNLDLLVDQSNKEGWNTKGLLVAGDRVRSVTRSVVNWTPKSENY